MPSVIRLSFISKINRISCFGKFATQCTVLKMEVHVKSIGVGKIFLFFHLEMSKYSVALLIWKKKIGQMIRI